MVERMVPLDQLIRPDDDIISAQGPAGEVKEKEDDEENWEVQSS